MISKTVHIFCMKPVAILSFQTLYFFIHQKKFCIKIFEKLYFVIDVKFFILQVCNIYLMVTIRNL